MKKNFKRTLAKVMAVALTVSMVGVASTDADAAKKIKLSSKSISVAKGATKKVTIKNVKAKKLKKLTVKSANKKIATVKKAGKTAIKVTGKKAGKSTKVTVKVKVGKKTTKLTLKVKVTKATAPSTAPEASASATPAASASATPAASASATPAASASATPAASASAAPATNAPASEAPATNAPASEAPATVETTDVANIQLGGKQSSLVSYFDVNEGAAEIATNASAQYGGVYTYFDVNYSDLSTLKTLSFDMKALSGDTSYKHVYLLAANPDSESPNAMPAEINYSWDSNAFTNVLMVEVIGNVMDLIEPEGTFSVDFDQDMIDKLTDEIDDLNGSIRFSIFINVGPTDYTISNVKLVGTEKYTEAFAAPSAKIDHKDLDVLTAATVETPQILDLANDTVGVKIAEAAAQYGEEVKSYTITPAQVDNTDVLVVTDNKTGSETLSVKEGYTLPEGKSYVSVAVDIKVTLKSGATLSSSVTIIVGDNSTLDVKGLVEGALGKDTAYTLLDLTSEDVVSAFGSGTFKTIKKNGVNALEVSISGGWNHGVSLAVDSSKAVSKFVIITEQAAKDGAQLVTKPDGSGAANNNYPYSGFNTPKTEVISYDEAVSMENISIAGNTDVGAAGGFIVYAVAVVYAD